MWHFLLLFLVASPIILYVMLIIIFSHSRYSSSPYRMPEGLHIKLVAQTDDVELAIVPYVGQESSTSVTLVDGNTLSSISTVDRTANIEKRGAVDEGIYNHRQADQKEMLNSEKYLLHEMVNEGRDRPDSEAYQCRCNLGVKRVPACCGRLRTPRRHDRQGLSALPCRVSGTSDHKRRLIEFATNTTMTQHIKYSERIPVPVFIAGRCIDGDWSPSIVVNGNQLTFNDEVEAMELYARYRHGMEETECRHKQAAVKTKRTKNVRIRIDKDAALTIVDEDPKFLDLPRGQKRRH
ncbi:hypothetical protein V1517DRAFT_310124 [Lipomyces orientalis]|uniref:Uncharacterized protein n=1 Tax=Lipomyces orientalis TaxID=1233043 RepID=A0ACC3TGV4_9ASCO